jgi:hypothetical protein
MIRRVVPIAVLLTLGCGKSSGPSPRDATTAPSAEVAVAEPAPDLSPVPPPAELVAVGRIARPRTLVETLASWSGVPVRLTDVLPPEMRDLEHVIAWDAPLEVAAALDRKSTAKVPEPLFVASVGLVSIDKALELARDRGAGLTAMGPGIFRLNVHEDVSCAIAASVGMAPARLVCGNEWPDVEELLPYATRGLPTRDLGAYDVNIELVAEPVRRRYAQEITQLRAMAGLALRMASLDDKRFDSALTDVAYGIADELKALANEVDRVQLTAKLDMTGKTLDVAETLVLRTAGLERSFVSQIIQDTGRRATPPPDVFWELPAEANSAGYSVSGDPQRFVSIVKSLGELADAYLEHEKVAPSLRKRIRRLIEAYPSMVGSGAFANGPAAVKSPLTSMGWSVGVANQRADVITATLSDVVGLLQDRELAKGLKKWFEVDPKILPKGRTQAVRVKGFPARGTSYTFDFPAAFVKRLSEIDPKRSGAAAEPVKAVSFTIIVVPDGERSYVAYGTEAKQLTTLLEGVRAGTQKKLADRTELAALRQGRSVWGGFWTLEALVQYMQDTLGDRGQQMLARAPNHGRSPWLVRFDISEQASSLVLTGVAKIPRGAFQDAGSVLPDVAASGLLSQSGARP